MGAIIEGWRRETQELTARRDKEFHKYLKQKAWGGGGGKGHVYDVNSPFDCSTGGRGFFAYAIPRDHAAERD